MKFATHAHSPADHDFSSLFLVIEVK